MYFSRIIPATLFAVLATAAPAPAPQTVNVDYAAIEAFRANLQGICSNIDASLSGASGEFNGLIGGFSGDTASAFQQIWAQIGNGNYEIQDACAQLISGLGGLSETYSQAESDNAAAFAGLLGKA
ncbi:hypothetical protein BJX63DRAFT_394412 [Aspergillus granulosus]|uniref:Uncharacterized protein n=1 Tax=Aspergillus granulosus TaxID=176169 RepID=A0ABR4HD60_9EURO